jgi:uncharacterized protein (TIGR03083 family)
MGKFMDKAAIQEAMRTRHGELEETLRLVSEEQMLEPAFEGGWSVKDILAHVSWWERRTAGRIGAWRRGEEVPKLGGNIDKINARVYEENRQRPLAEVIEDFHRSFKEIMEQLDALSDEELRDKSLKDSEGFAWTYGRAIRDFIREDGYYHYSEHSRQIRRHFLAGS